MLNFITKQHKFIFAAGAAVGIATLRLLKSNTARAAAVKGLANGIMLKDKVLETAANIKEEAGDIVAEAKVAAQGECDCGGKCS